jgi:hypothetical protein
MSKVNSSKVIMQDENYKMFMQQRCAFMGAGGLHYFNRHWRSIITEKIEK